MRLSWPVVSAVRKTESRSPAQIPCYRDKCLFLRRFMGWNNKKTLGVNSVHIKVQDNVNYETTELRQSRLAASRNNFHNKTVPCTIWGQWCITVLIAQETETFHPLNSGESFLWHAQSHCLQSYLHISDSSPGYNQPPPAEDPTESPTSPLDTRWGDVEEDG